MYTSDGATLQATLGDEVYVDEDSSYGEAYMGSLSDGFSAGFDAGVEVGTEDGEIDEVEPEVETERPGFFSGGMMYEYTVCEYFSFLTSATTLLVLAGLFAAFLFAIDIRGGFRKNLIKINPNRWIAFSSKVITVFVYNVLFVVVAFVTAFVCIALMGKSLVFGFSLEFFALVALRLLTMFAFAMFIGLITCFTKSTALGMVADLIFGLGVLDILFYLLDLLLVFIGTKLNFTVPAGFQLSNYTITGVASMLQPGMSNRLIIRTIVVCLCFAVVSIAGAGFLNQKRDIH